MTGSTTPAKVGLIACDLDGTLLRSDGRVSARTFEVLSQVKEAGGVVVAATGRGPSALPTFEKAGVIEFAVCSNGAAVVDLASGEILERSELEGSAAAMAIGEVRTAIVGSSFAWDTAAGFGWEEAFAPHGQLLLDSYGSVGSVAFDSAMSVGKTFVAHGEIGYEELAERVKAAISADVEVTSAGLPFVVITAPGVNKATTLGRLCGRLGIEESAVVAFGDSWNDVDMLEWAGTGVAMANANDAVKEAADAVAGSHDDDGVANFLADLFGF